MFNPSSAYHCSQFEFIFRIFTHFEVVDRGNETQV